MADKGFTVLSTRVEPAFRAEVRREADHAFEGNESRVVRRALRDFLTLRQALGPDYEATLARLLGAYPAEPADRAA